MTLSTNSNKNYQHLSTSPLRYLVHLEQNFACLNLTLILLLLQAVKSSGSTLLSYSNRSSTYWNRNRWVSILRVSSSSRQPLFLSSKLPALKNTGIKRLISHIRVPLITVYSLFSSSNATFVNIHLFRIVSTALIAYFYPEKIHLSVQLMCTLSWRNQLIRSYSHDCCLHPAII